MTYTDIQQLLVEQAESLLTFSSPKISKDHLHVPSPDHVSTIFGLSDRSHTVQENLQALYSAGRLANTGYLSILPVDQGIEHSAGASFAKNIEYFDPEHIVELAVEGGCSGVASTLGVLGMVSTAYADKIPFIAKINHNDFLRYPNTYDQTLFGSVERAYNLGAKGIGATIYFGSEESKRQIEEIGAAFEDAHSMGMFTILWCYLRNDGFKVDGVEYHTAADLTGQANHIGVTLGADIIKQKLPTINGGYAAINATKKYGKFDDAMYTQLASEHPIDLCRYQVANCYMGRIGLINSGGESGSNDIQDAVATAVINKRAGGQGLILGRKAFQKSRAEGIAILNAVQDVYLCKDIDVA